MHPAVWPVLTRDFGDGVTRDFYLIIRAPDADLRAHGESVVRVFRARGTCEGVAGSVYFIAD